MGLQAGAKMVARQIKWGCRPDYMRLQTRLHRVACQVTYGCRSDYAGLQARLHGVAGCTSAHILINMT